MMKSCQKVLKSLLCFAAFFCVYIPTANADIIFKSGSPAGGIVLRYETNQRWSDIPHYFYWGERHGERNYGRPHYDNRPGYNRPKHDNRPGYNRPNYRQPKHDHKKFDDHRRDHRNSHDRRW